MKRVFPKFDGQTRQIGEVLVDLLSNALNFIRNFNEKLHITQDFTSNSSPILSRVVEKIM
jgi:signal transduction histidine kinase